MKKLQAKSDYRSQRFHCSAGDIVEVSDELAAWLANDAPGVFVEYAPPAKAADEPPKDKAVKRAPRKK